MIFHIPPETGRSVAKKKAPHKRGLVLQERRLVSAGEAEDAEQADKDVVQRDIQADRGADVVGFTAADDVAGLEQDGARRDQDEHRANRQVQRRQLQEQVSDHTNQDDHHAGHQHPAKE